MSGVFLHVDMDAFFASVEQLDNPQYRNRPVVVGGLPEKERSVVSTASYEARAFGVHSAMPSARAKRLCPNAIFLRPRMERYREKSREIMRILENYSPDVVQMSIDEALVDLTGTEKLFGAPEKVALRIKNEIHEKTGLTVSIGLASTRYIAKIASGMRKPNGLFVVPRGKEEAFMLSLPLEKLWGVGSKTLAKIKNAGFSSVASLNAVSLEILKANFGKAGGQFLFNAVHAIEDKNLAKEAQSHSISSERTFEKDLSDKDAIESRLLEIAQDVMFRLYDAGKTGKTVSVKIRFDDFSTVSVQNTQESVVSSTDDLFDRAKMLLKSKLRDDKKIRLLGICVQNVEDEGKAQKELFDFGNEKKQKLDRLIFEMEKKNPAIKIVKARLLEKPKALLPFVLLIPLIFCAKASAQTKIVSEDENLELSIRGHWFSTVETSAGLSGGYGNGFETTQQNPVFVQNVDMSLYFLLNKMWYFEADFADEFDTNTIAAGYIGNGYLKHARISNRGITFPQEYSVNLFQSSITGGENESPGFLLHFEGEKWKADTVFRYDMMRAKSKTFYGLSEENTQEINLSDYETGYQFSLPEDLCRDIAEVFVESDSGSYRANKRRFRKLGVDEYIISASEKTLTLFESAKAKRNQNGELPAVLVTFATSTKSAISAQLGSWSDETSFLGEIQAYFGKNAKKVDVKKYAFDLFTTISAKDALVLQSPDGFSPFANCALYSTTSSDISKSAVISTSTKTESSDYIATVIEKEGDDESESIIEISAKSSSDASKRFPLADRFAGFYLGFSQDCDFVLQATEYTQSSGYEISEKAASVSVYINDILDTDATYNSENGLVTPSVSVGETDKVRIIWYEESGYSKTGAFTGAAGFSYEFFDGLTADISAAARYSYSPSEEFATASTASPAFATAATALRYKSDSLEVEAAAALSASTDNTTGLYRILGMDDEKATTIQLSQEAGKAVPDEIDIVLSPRPSLSEDSAFTLPLALAESQKDKSEVKSGSKESGISGYTIPISWDFSAMSATEQNPVWRAVTIELGSDGTALASAQTFSIALKNENPSAFLSSSAVEVFLQLGVNTQEDFSAESQTIPTWLISKTGAKDTQRPFLLSKSGWQTVTVKLTDEDRAKLSVYTGARVLIVSSDESAVKSGLIKAGVFEIAGTSFAISADEAFSTTLREDTPSSISAEWGVNVEKIQDSTAEKLNKSENTIAALKWKAQSESDIQDTHIIMSRYIEQTDISSYKTLSFFAFFTKAMSAEDTLSFSFLRTEASADENESAVEFSLSGDKIASERWHKIQVDLESESVYVDSDYAAKANVNTDIIASKVVFDINSENTDEGCFFADELYLSDISPVIAVQDSFSVSYKKEGAILSALDTQILHDFFVNAKAKSAKSKKKTIGDESVSAGIGIWKIDIEANEAHSSESKYLFSSIGHSAKTSSAIFDIFDFSEVFQSDNEGKKQQKENSASIDLSALRLEASTKASTSALYQTQQSTALAQLEIAGFSLDSQVEVSQKTSGEFQSDYEKAYKSNSKMQFDFGKAEAQKRKVFAESTMFYNFSAIKFTPEIHAEAKDTYQSLSSDKQTDYTQYLLTLPFAIKDNRFSLFYKREAGGNTKVKKGGSYKEDAKYYAENYPEYILSAPFITDLTSEALADEILSQSSSSESSQYYYATYGASWKRAQTDNALDLILPTAVSASFARNITAASTKSDIYNAKASMLYSANNVLGSYSALRLFKWYNEDEFSSLFSSSVKIPKNSPADKTYSAEAELSSTLFISKADSLKSALDGEINSDEEWSARISVAYKRERKTSPIVSLAKAFRPTLDTSSLVVTKTDSLKAALSQTKSSTTTNARFTKKQSVVYTHESDVAFSKFLTITTSVSPEVSNTAQKVIYIGITLSLGVRLTF